MVQLIISILCLFRSKNGEDKPLFFYAAIHFPLEIMRMNTRERFTFILNKIHSPKSSMLGVVKMEFDTHVRLATSQ